MNRPAYKVDGGRPKTIVMGCLISIVMGLTKKYCHAEFISASIESCHAELVSASVLDIVHRFRNEFGMTPGGKLVGHPHPLNTVMLNLFQHLR